MSPVADMLLFYIWHDYIVNTDALMCIGSILMKQIKVELVLMTWYTVRQLSTGAPNFRVTRYIRGVTTWLMGLERRETKFCFKCIYLSVEYWIILAHWANVIHNDIVWRFRVELSLIDVWTFSKGPNYTQLFSEWPQAKKLGNLWFKF